MKWDGYQLNPLSQFLELLATQVKSSVTRGGRAGDNL